jgi:hypothetical protein
MLTSLVGCHGGADSDIADATQRISTASETARVVARSEVFGREADRFERETADANLGGTFLKDLALLNVAGRQESVDLLRTNLSGTTQALQAALAMERRHTEQLEAQLTEASVPLGRAGTADNLAVTNFGATPLGFRGQLRWLLPVATLVAFWATVGLLTRPWWRAQWRRRRGALVGFVSLGCLVVSVGPLVLLDRLTFSEITLDSLATQPPVPVNRQAAEEQWTAARARYEQGYAAWRRAVMDSPFKQQPMEELLHDWQNFREKSMELAAELRVQEQLAKRRAPLPSAVRWWIPAVAILVVGHWLLLGAVWGLRRLLFPPSCPMCGAPRMRKARDGSYHCKATADRKDAKGTCSFMVTKRQRNSRRLYFPIVGNWRTGKSISLVAVYESIRQARYDSALTLHWETSTVTGYEDLEKARRVIWEAGPESVENTKLELPRPVIFDVADCDPWRGGKTLVNLADFSGEVLQVLPEDDPLRLRMFSAEGVLFVVDLDQFDRERELGGDRPAAGFQERELLDWRDADTPEHSPKGSAGRDQLQALNDFVSKFNEQKSRAPVAVCISKIDELLKGRVGRRHEFAANRFYETIAKIERSRKVGRAGLSVIRQRHEAVCELIDSIWGLAVEKQLVRLECGPYLYFPVTSFGFQRPAGPGPLKPWGELEPLMWLLHMNGLAVFPPPPRVRR